MGDAAVEAGEQGGGFRGDDGGFEVGAGEIADGFERVPVGLDDDFDFALRAAKRNRGSQIAGNTAKFGQNVLGEMFKIFGQLRFSGASGPATRDCSGWRSRVRG